MRLIPLLCVCLACGPRLDGPLEGVINGKPFSQATGRAVPLTFTGTSRASIDVWSGGSQHCGELPSTITSRPSFHTELALVKGIYGNFELNGVQGFFLTADGKRVPAQGTFAVVDAVGTHDGTATLRLHALAQDMSLDGEVTLRVCTR